MCIRDRDDERLHDEDDVDRGPGPRLHRETTRPERTEEDTREHDAQRLGATEECHRDRVEAEARGNTRGQHPLGTCLLYTSDAADDLTRVDLGGRRIIKKKKTKT